MRQGVTTDRPRDIQGMSITVAFTMPPNRLLVSLASEEAQKGRRQKTVILERVFTGDLL